MTPGDDASDTDGAPASPSPPPPPPPPPPPLAPLGPAAGPLRRRNKVWAIVGGTLAVLLAALLVVGFSYHVDRRLIRPGDATPLSAGISITGAKEYHPRGSFLLLTVFVDDHPSLVRYLQQKLFGADVTEEKLPPPSPVNSDQQNVCDMSDSQATAKLVALRKLGYTPTPLPGVLVETVSGAAPAARTLRCGDVIDSVDGSKTASPDDLHRAITSHKPGDDVTISFRRDGKSQSARVQLACPDPDPARNHRDIDAPDSASCRRAGATPLIGILVNVKFVYPVQININTGDVSGPSGGLAMTLTLLDLLTPCDLTGGHKIAVTGTIDADGTVGGIGGTPKKVIAARHAGAKLFIVAAGSDDLAAARKEAKNMKFVVVHNLDEALRALQQNGGDPLTCK